MIESACWLLLLASELILLADRSTCTRCGTLVGSWAVVVVVAPVVDSMTAEVVVAGIRAAGAAGKLVAVAGTQVAAVDNTTAVVAVAAADTILQTRNRICIE